MKLLFNIVNSYKFRIKSTDAISVEGFSLIEVLVALGLFAIIVSYSSNSILTQAGANHKAVIRSEAAQAAQTILDDLRNVDVSSMKATGSDNPVDIQVNANRVYAVTVEYCANSAYCTSSEARHIGITVNYRDKEVYSTETVFTGIAETATGVSNFNSGGGCWKC